MDMGQVYRSRFVRDRDNPPPLRKILDRDEELLLHLHRHGILDTQHLTTLERVSAWKQEANRQGQGTNTDDRLPKLFHHGYVERLDLPAIWRTQPYSLSSRGNSYLAKEKDIAKRSHKLKKASQLDHDLGQADFTVSLDAAVSELPNVRMIYPDEMLEHASDIVRTKRSWPVEIEWQGDRVTSWIKPDWFFGLEFLDRKGKRNKRYFVVEYDTGSMECVKHSVHQSSYLRKFLAYAATYRHGLYRKYLNVDFFYVLNVVGVTRAGEHNTRLPDIERSARRIEKLTTTFQNYGKQLSNPQTFLFTTKPAAPRRGEFENVLTSQWQDGAGEVIGLPM